MSDLGLLAAVVIAYGLISRRAERRGLTPPVACIALGLVLGPHVLGLLKADLHGPLILVAEVALVLVLFSDASRVKVDALRHSAGLPARLLLIGMPLTIALGTAVGAILLVDLSFWEGAIVAAVLAPTDAALGAAVVTNRAVPQRLRQALNVESGLNDGLSVPFLTLFVAFAGVESEVEPAAHWAGFAVEQIGLGALAGLVVGGVGGALVDRASEHGWASGVFEQLSVIALAVGAWAAAGALGGNGFIAAFTAGLLAGVTLAGRVQHVVDFTEEEGQLLNLAVFLLFGALLPGLLKGVDWHIALYAALSLTVIRMLPVAIACAGSGLRKASIAFLGWFGPRGLASIILALVVVESESEIPGLEGVLGAMALTVVASAVLHGATAPPLARLIARRAGEAERRDAPDLPTRPRAEPPAAAVAGHAHAR